MRILMTASMALAMMLVPATADAAWFGSTMTAPVNTSYGCEAALILGPVGGVQLAPTNQTSCTYKHGGYLGSNRLGSVVPGTGRIARIRVKSGPNPAPLRLTILTGSARIDLTSGADIPETYTCCTARYLGPMFRPRPNAVTVRRVNVPVFDTRSGRLDNRTHATDVVAISAFGPGTLPLAVRDDVGTTASGSPIATGFWSATATNEPRVDGYTMTGIDVLLGWDFRPRRR
ncbi:MAG: hypothetical protein U0S48_02740 [Solirubrobacteraceae bacterium]